MRHKSYMLVHPVRYGHLDQSLYARFVRLKTPTVDLNLQGSRHSGSANHIFSSCYPGSLGICRCLKASLHCSASQHRRPVLSTVRVGDTDVRPQRGPGNLGDLVGEPQHRRPPGTRESKTFIGGLDDFSRGSVDRIGRWVFR